MTQWVDFTISPFSGGLRFLFFPEKPELVLQKNTNFNKRKRTMHILL